MDRSDFWDDLSGTIFESLYQSWLKNIFLCKIEQNRETITITIYYSPSKESNHDDIKSNNYKVKPARTVSKILLQNRPPKRYLLFSFSIIYLKNDLTKNKIHNIHTTYTVKERDITNARDPKFPF